MIQLARTFHDISMTETKPDGPVYEIRKYGFNIHGMTEYCKVLNGKFWKLRTSFSTVLGPWKSEINTLCEMVYIARYDSLSHLLKTREKMNADEEWNQELMRIADLQMSFKNFLTVLAPQSSLRADFVPSDSAVYLLLTLPESATCNVDLMHSSDSTVVGRFISVFGPSKTEFRLLRYPHPDAAFADAARGRKLLPSGANSQLMVPAPMSNMK